MSIPKINFAPSVTELELQKIEQERSQKTQKVFQPGVYDLKVLEFVHNVTDRNPTGTSSGDPTWLVFKLVLGGLDARSISTYVLIPTQSDRYNKPGTKNPLMMIGKFREFLRALGVVPEQTQMKNIITKLATDPGSITGMELKVRIGYNKPYIQYNPESKGYSLVTAKGVSMEDGVEYTDRNSAIAAAANLGVREVQAFPEVLRLFEKEEEAVESVKLDTLPTDWD